MKAMVINILDSNDIPGGIGQYHLTLKWSIPYQLKYPNPGSQIPSTPSRKSPPKEEKRARSRYDVAITTQQAVKQHGHASRYQDTGLSMRAEQTFPK